MTILEIYRIPRFEKTVLFGKYQPTFLFPQFILFRLYADETRNNQTEIVHDTATGFIKLHDCNATAVCTVDDIVEVVQIWDDVSIPRCPLLNEHWDI